MNNVETVSSAEAGSKGKEKEVKDTGQNRNNGGAIGPVGNGTKGKEKKVGMLDRAKKVGYGITILDIWELRKIHLEVEMWIE